jgi:cysteine desulfurase
MTPWWKCGNAASSHPEGKAAQKAVSNSRLAIARAIGAKAHEIVFTSGATEADNLALKGYAEAADDPHVVTVATEHKAVLRSAEVLEAHGVPVDVLPVNRDGLVDVDMIEGAARPGSLVSVMTVNNETGVIQPIREISRACQRKGAIFHTDAAQAFGRVPLRVAGIDLMSLSAHKIYGPKGVGALYIREGTKIEPQLHGGRQEHRMRAGTTPTPLCVAFAKAADLSVSELARSNKLVEGLRDRLLAGLPNAAVAGRGAPRAPGITCLIFSGISGKELLELVCESICCSAGSACSKDGPSHVLAAMGIEGAPLRVSIGRFTTARDVDLAAKQISKAVEQLHPAGRRALGLAYSW